MELNSASQIIELYFFRLKMCVVFFSPFLAAKFLTMIVEVLEIHKASVSGKAK